MRHLPKKLGVVVGILVGLAGLYYLTILIYMRYFWSPPDLTVLARHMQDCMKVISDMRATADLIVSREPSGSLIVSGRAIQGAPLTLRSTEELDSLLRGLPHGGTAVVDVAYQPSSSGVQALFESPPSDVRHARAELMAVLVTRGFKQPSPSPEGPPCTLLPCRPTTR